jgi:iron complex transport system substrate-binding protein
MHVPNLSRLLVWSLLIALFVSGCAPAATSPPPASTLAPSPTPESKVLTDGLGRQLTVGSPFERIASLAPSNTEILFALGAGSQVVARDTFSDYPEGAKSLADIGGGFGQIDTETLVSLKPDLVLAAEINPVENVKLLEDLGLKVYYLSNPKDLNGLYENLRTVAILAGREGEAESLIQNLQGRVADVEAKVANATQHPLVFYELDATDPNAPWTSGPDTFIDLLLTMAGGSNLGKMLNTSWAQISVEELITQNPDIILLGDYTLGGIKPEEVMARPGWESIAAVKNKQVFPFDDNLVSRPGPRMVDGLESLAKILHPELFP